MGTENDTIIGYKVIKISPTQYALCVMKIEKSDIFINTGGQRVAKKVFVTNITDKDGMPISDEGYSYWVSYDRPEESDFIYTVGKYAEDLTGTGIFFYETKEELFDYINSRYWMKSFFL